jgi:CRP-like cAMP-binding protein
MPDYNPMVLRRLLALRQFPLFAAVELDELAMVAENVTEVTFAAHDVIVNVDTRVPAIHLIVDGRIDDRRSYGPRQIFGALEVFAGRPAASSAVAGVATQTMQIAASDFSDILEDNFGLMQLVLRTLADRMVGSDARRRAARVLVPATRPLGMVERLIVLRQQTPFAAARLQSLAILAHIAREAMWPAGERIELDGDALILHDGELRETIGARESKRFGPGDAVGLVESLAGRPRERTLDALTPVSALRIPHSAILDVIEDHADLGFAMIQAFAAALLDATPPVELGAAN